MNSDIVYMLFTPIWSDIESHKSEIRYTLYVVFLQYGAI